MRDWCGFTAVSPGSNLFPGDAALADRACEMARPAEAQLALAASNREV